MLGIRKRRPRAGNGISERVEGRLVTPSIMLVCEAIHSAIVLDVVSSYVYSPRILGADEGRNKFKVQGNVQVLARHYQP